MISSLTMFYPKHSVCLPYIEAINELKKEPFGVYLEFIDPRNNSLIQKLFPFFYEPLNTYGLKGRCLITEWQGLPVYIPSDLNLYIRQQQGTDRSYIEFRQHLGFLSGGRFVTKEVRVEVGINFRLGTQFDSEFLPLLLRSGHEYLAGKVAGVA